MNSTGRESDKFMLRLPEGMRERIKTVADANGRSMNAEIVLALEEKFPAPVIGEPEGWLRWLSDMLKNHPASPPIQEVQREVLRMLRKGSGICTPEEVLEVTIRAVMAMDEHRHRFK